MKFFLWIQYISIALEINYFQEYILTFMKVRARLMTREVKDQGEVQGQIKLHVIKKI